MVLVVRLANPEQSAVIAACYVAANLVAVRVYHSARLALDDGLPRARVLK